MSRWWEPSWNPFTTACAVLALSCGGSDSKRCRVGAAFEQNPVARQLALSRCEHIADREYVEQTRQDDFQRERQAERNRKASAERESERREIRERIAARLAVRRNPRPPELGATQKESATVCAKQGGEHATWRSSEAAGLRLVCKVDGQAIYVAFSPEGRDSISTVQTLYEGGDLAATRSTLESQMGPPSRVDVKNGYRIWTWENTNPLVDLRSYAHGVAVTLKTPE
jgi:hypothetical protein